LRTEAIEGNRLTRRIDVKDVAIHAIAAIGVIVAKRIAVRIGFVSEGNSERK